MQFDKGGQRIRLTGRAHLYEREGSHLRRLSDPRFPTTTRAILSNRIRLSPELRAVGNAYGGWVEELRAGGSQEFLRDYVEGGGSASGGPAPYLLAISERVRIAQAALAELSDLRHPGSGPHHPITHRQLVDDICIQGADLMEIALKAGWIIWANDPDGERKAEVPKRRYQKLKEGLETGLKAISEQWKGTNAGPNNIDEPLIVR